MIRRANNNDAQLILQRLSEVENAPKEDEETVLQYLNLEEGAVFVDDTQDAICRVAVSHERKEINVVWLLPTSLGKKTLAPLLFTTFYDIYQRMPQARTYLCWATFASGRGCLKDHTAAGDGEKFAYEWSQFFPNEGKTNYQLTNLNWRVYVDSLEKLQASKTIVDIT